MEIQTNEKEKEKILFQHIMSSKAYRRGMLLCRVPITAVVAGALAGFCAISVILGILLAAMAICFGVVFILAALGSEHTYTVYNTRVVIKRRGDYSRKSVPIGSITSVKCKSAFYEKDLHTATIYIKAKDDSGKVKRYRMRHVFDYKPVADYLVSAINGGKADAE